MLRSFLIYVSKAAWAQKIVSSWGFAWRTASRFVAGTKIEDAITAIQELNAKGINVTLDHLGENTTKPEEASEATDEILNTLDEIKKTNLCANVSIKLTQIGLSLDERLCAENLEKILSRARGHDNFVRIDMEDTPYTDKTINLFYQMRKKGYKNTGLVLQSYLYRTEADARKLLGDFTPIRLVKGAYQEPVDKAFPKKVDVDANYDLLTKIMIDTVVSQNPVPNNSDGCYPPIPAIATHDENRIAFAKQYLQKVGLPKNSIEFQMLYGIRRDLQETLIKEGYPVRVYVPFGTHWYPYFMRRLAERPANVWFFISNFFRK
jgi:proline dehydrogenase